MFFLLGLTILHYKAICKTAYCDMISATIVVSNSFCFLSSIIIISHSSYFRCSFSLFPNHCIFIIHYRGFQIHLSLTIQYHYSQSSSGLFISYHHFQSILLPSFIMRICKIHLRLSSIVLITKCYFAFIHYHLFQIHLTFSSIIIIPKMHLTFVICGYHFQFILHIIIHYIISISSYLFFLKLISWL